MTFTVLGLTGYWYGLVIGLSAIAYLCLAGVLGYRKRLPAGTVRLYGLLALPLGLLLARLVYCVARFSYFTEVISQPWRMLNFWDGGFSMVGALCGLILAALITSRIQKVRFGLVLDVTTVPLGLLLFGMRLAEAFTEGQLGVGKQVDIGSLAQTAPWLWIQDQMGVLTIYRLAVYRYEAVAALVILALSLGLFFGRHPRRKAKFGDLAMIVYSMVGASQVLLESLRDDGHMVSGFIRLQQLGFALMPILALIILGARYAHIREARKPTILAWLLIPVGLLVALLMVHPLNHVLDLTGHRLLGLILLGVLAVYMLFFLRFKGANPRLILSWLIMLAALAGCVMVEFSVDGSDNLIRDYGIMALCCLILFLTPFSLWRQLKSHIYREESISVHIQRQWN